jgi:hypothetical protein
LEEQGLAFSREADPATLVRRVSLDLTGLPPSPADVEAFVTDRRATAYEQLVDRLLASDAYAERMTTDWLDLARYADSQGLHSDGWRSMYPWRDWVINAFKDNMPFDQFILEQIAGDHLSSPSQKQIIATGFNRNHKTSAEGGVVDEELKKEYAHDRVATTATGLLGLTMECARCHDHKYDPISQKEYYEFFAFFDQVDEVGMTGDDGNSGPNLLLPDAAIRTKIDSLTNLIEDKKHILESNRRKLKDQIAYINKLENVDQELRTNRVVYLPFEKLSKQRSIDGQSNITASEGVEIIDSDRGKVLELNSEYEYLTLKDIGLFDQYQSFSGSVWIYPTSKRPAQTIMGNSGQKGVFWRGWDFMLDSLDRPTLRLINALPHDMIVVSAEESVATNAWTHLAFSYDGSGIAAGIKISINGKGAGRILVRDQLQRSIYPMAFNKERTDTPLRVGKSYRAFTGEYGIYEGKMDDLMIFERMLSALEVSQLAGIQNIKTEIDLHRQEPTEESEKRVEDFMRCAFPDPVEKDIADLRKKIIELLTGVPEVMVMQDIPKRNPTHILIRGNYDQPGEEVYPSAPVAIMAFSDSLPQNRLGLANWLVDSRNPLTGRVFVNRIWQQFFGRGIVSTPHDFGLQGQLPSHPELLDYLAYQFIAKGWDVKALVKEIVMSNTYRQTSETSKEKFSKDPENLYLSRGPSGRLSAEILRDQALTGASLLNKQIGGPSVKPYQPEGLWEEKTSSTHLLRAYISDEGAAKYRRSLYTFVRRTSMHPMMEIFDAPTRSVCTVQRQTTDSPVQSLVLLNDPQFIEAARTLAENELKTEKVVEDQLASAYYKLCGRSISPEKLTELLTLYEEEKDRFSKDMDHADEYINIGQFPPDPELKREELAALTLAVNTIMNLDDFYMKR